MKSYCILVVVVLLQLFTLSSGFRNYGSQVSKKLFARKALKLTKNNALEKEVPNLSLAKEGLKYVDALNGESLTIGVISARWNADIINGLYQGVTESLLSCNVKEANIHRIITPGAFELPVAAKFLAATKKYDAIICLGCLIKGETMHFEYISQATSSGVMQVGLDHSIPCLFGVLTVLSKEQAIKRSTGDTNEGLSWGRSAVEMGLLRQQYLTTGNASEEKVSLGF